MMTQKMTIFREIIKKKQINCTCNNRLFMHKGSLTMAVKGMREGGGGLSESIR